MSTNVSDKTPTRPRFDDLPLRPGDPKGSAWGFWGDDDQLGTLNLLTEDRITDAAKEIKLGIRIPLKFEPPQKCT